jgi:hypothetical protein
MTGHPHHRKPCSIPIAIPLHRAATRNSYVCAPARAKLLRNGSACACFDLDVRMVRCEALQARGPKSHESGACEKGVKAMSNGIDPLKDIFHISDEEKKALETAGSIISAIGSVWSGVTTLKSALATLGILSQDDPVKTMRGYIDALTHDFHGAVAALDAELSMRAVADHLNAARTQLLSLTELAPEMRRRSASTRHGMLCVPSSSMLPCKPC